MVIPPARAALLLAASIAVGLLIGGWRPWGNPSAAGPGAVGAADVPVTGGAAGRPAEIQVASAQAAYPAPELVADARRHAQQWRQRLDGSFHLVEAAPFVLAGNLPEEELRLHLRRSVQRPAEAMWRSYFRARPDRVITILLLGDDASYRSWAKRLFGDEDISRYGYYRPAERTLVMNISTGGGTLLHELTHALIVYDWPDVPLWFNEALASLHEQCEVTDSRILGRPNWRLPALQQAIRDGHLRPLAELTERDDFYGTQRGLNYAQARYFCLYLQRRGLLAEFYRRYRDAHGRQEPATAVIEAFTGQSIADVDAAMRAFTLELEHPSP